jgi:hypothetical protein
VKPVNPVHNHYMSAIALHRWVFNLLLLLGKRLLNYQFYPRSVSKKNHYDFSKIYWLPEFEAELKEIKKKEFYAH